MRTIFSYACLPSGHLWWGVSECLWPVLFLFELLVSLWLDFEFFMYFGYIFFFRNILCKYLLPACVLSSTSLDVVSPIVEVSNLNETQLTSFFFYGLWLLCYIKKNHHIYSHVGFLIWGTRWGYPLLPLFQHHTESVANAIIQENGISGIYRSGKKT